MAQFKKNNFQKKIHAEIKELKKEVDGINLLKNNLKQTKNIVITGNQMVETVTTTFTPIQCQGLTSAIKMDPDAIDDIKHLSLKHMGLVAVEPEYRLMHKLVGNVMILHQVNSAGLATKTDKTQKLNDVNGK